MIELPESITYASMLNQYILGKTVAAVCPPSAPHKFCWFHGDVNAYDSLLKGKSVERADAYGIFVEITFEGGLYLNFNDGVNVRLLEEGEKPPKKYQLLIAFDDGSALVFTVAMYGGIACHQGEFDNEYYLKNRAGITPLDPGFTEEYFLKLTESVKPNTSAKAFLATQQRFLGLGNGTLQDILFYAGIHPKRKLVTLSREELLGLLASVKKILGEMAEKGGRDTEKNLLGQTGGYATVMSRNTQTSGCPCCGGQIVKESYMGGSVYYCPDCQPLVK
ncbi:endonuclease VIII [Lactonifactor sp. BIOML-A3]|uniref:DNA-formamidopyrimidine glycosylase family protein n=1 Tax=Lactonifactor TaxID=420345 RepID=UPI0012B0A7A7|nr:MULTISPECIES: DNA-formamidopyrimidine glycosylase family protein [Lactonifactor]MCB5714502.1 endonuclease VIII [Lactonifactor longoviformis]MCB5718456.1 endonuclease VIII [Lactonifactor longoviformis]MSA01642.1 endonuclease VIII [Lactonifactor sp. BIOML-A5]MSA08640.1 endonuclease VIII [Lactonifactor sp. BIOML-A4]MSA13964.1 endonuclease VIII [Lactonifactor sp. BIOML-A3]